MDTLDTGTPVDTHYVCVDTKDVNVREGFDLDSAIVRKLKSGEIVHGVRTCHNTKRHLRLELDDGSWTSIHAGLSSDPFLRAAAVINTPYVCVYQGVNVRKGFHLDSSVVRTLEIGDVVKGLLSCTNPNKILRLRLEDGTWTSIHGGSPSEPLLLAGNHVDEHYVCVATETVNVREAFQLDSTVTRRLKYGDVIHGRMTCVNSDGVVRLLLAEGSWTSVRGREGVFLVSVNSLLEERQKRLDDVLCQVCMDKSKRIVFNCGHQSCEACAPSLKSCPECRTAITARIKLFA